MGQGTSNPNDVAERIATEAATQIEDAKAQAAQEAAAQHAEQDRDARLSEAHSRLDALEARPAATTYDDSALHAKIDALNERLAQLAPQPAAPSKTDTEDKADQVEDARSTLNDVAANANARTREVVAPTRGNSHFLMRPIGSFFGRGDR